MVQPTNQTPPDKIAYPPEAQEEIATLRQALARAEQRVRELEGLVRPEEGSAAVRDLADALPLFVAAVDRNGRYEFVNQSYEQWFGRPRSEIVGQTVREVLGEDAYTGRADRLTAALNGERQNFETETPRQDGSTRCTEIEYLPRTASDGSPAGFYVLAMDVTERRSGDRAVRESEARLRLALDAGRMAVWEVDLATDTLVPTPELCRLFGLPEGSSPTLDDIRAMYHPGERERLQEVARAALERGDRYAEAELRIVRADGQHRWLVLRAEVILDGQGAPQRYVGVLFDITERRQIAERLEASEQKLRSALSAARLGAWERDLQSGEFVTTEACKLNLGLSRDATLTFEMLQAMRHPDDAERVGEAIRKAIVERREYDVEYRVIWPDGSIRWLLARGNAIHGHDGRPVRMVGVTLDVTERKLADERLQRSEKLKAAMLEAALDCIITFDEDSRVIEWNPAAEKTFGYPRESALGRDVAELIAPADQRELHRETMARYLSTGEGAFLDRRLELEAARADGTRFPVEFAVSAINLGGRRLFTSYLRDITERQQAEAALKMSEQRLQATCEHALAGIVEVAADGRFLRVNEQFCVITGYSREELLSRTFAEITHPEDRDEDLQTFSRLMRGEIGPYVLEKRYVHKKGPPLWIEVAVSKVDDPEGNPLYGVRIVRDISERKRAEQHRNLLMNELNHRVKNTLATVQAIVGQALRTSRTTQDARAAIDSRLVALARVHDVLTRESWEGASLAEIMSQAVAPFVTAGQDRIAISGPDIWLPPKTALSLAMAAQELSTNAVKYGALSNATGSVSITWNADPAAGDLSLRWEESGGPAVVAPEHRGFGSRLLERALPGELRGEVRLQFLPSGVVCELGVPLQ